MAAHNHVQVFGSFPTGVSDAPANASILVQLLSKLEQNALNQQFNMDYGVASHPTNYTARIQQVGVFLCPSDPSIGHILDNNPPPHTVGGVSGRSNYHANVGAHGWWFDSLGPAVKPENLKGVFTRNTSIGLESIRDGTSNTALFAEIKRGAAPNKNHLDVTRIMPNLWSKPGTNQGTNPNNLTPLAICESVILTANYTGLQYHRGSPAPPFTRTQCLQTTHVGIA